MKLSIHSFEQRLKADSGFPPLQREHQRSRLFIRMNIIFIQQSSPSPPGAREGVKVQRQKNAAAEGEGSPKATAIHQFFKCWRRQLSCRHSPKPRFPARVTLSPSTGISPRRCAWPTSRCSGSRIPPTPALPQW